MKALYLIVMMFVLSLSIVAESIKFSPNNYEVSPKTFVKNETKIKYGMTFVTNYYYDVDEKCLIVKQTSVSSKGKPYVSIRYSFADLSPKDVEDSMMFLFKDYSLRKIYRAVNYLEEEVKINGKLTKFDFTISSKINMI